MSERQSKIQRFPKDSILFHQGDRDKVLYKILTGTVGIYADYQGPREMRLALLTKGHCLGEMSILEGLPRSATAVAEEDCTLISYSEKLMADFIFQNPGFALELLENLSARLRSSSAELEHMHKMLLELSSQGRTDGDMNEYIKRHTAYGPDGEPRFYINV